MLQVLAIERSRIKRSLGAPSLIGHTFWHDISSWSKGQVVIPKDLRNLLGIEPGDEVTFWREDDRVALDRATSDRPLRGRYADLDLFGELEAERGKDWVREARLI